MPPVFTKHLANRLNQHCELEVVEASHGDVLRPGMVAIAPGNFHMTIRRVLTIWSNACSSGQEIFTIAMLIKENFPELFGWKVRLVPSDLSSKILERAKTGVFTQTEVNRGLPMQFLLKYFSKEGIQWKLKEEIRSMVEFRPINLIEPFPAA